MAFVAKVAMFIGSLVIGSLVICSLVGILQKCLRVNLCIRGSFDRLRMTTCIGVGNKKKLYILAAYLKIYLQNEQADSSIFFKRRIFY